MNPQPELQSDALRSEIDTTRERMDETIDALGNRLQGRHLLDEVIGFFRGRSDNSEGPGMGERLAHSAENALHSAVNTVKAHPVPTLMIGAGLAFLVYEARSRRRHDGMSDYDPDASTRYLDDSIGTYPEGFASTGETGEETGGLGDKASMVAGQAKEKFSELGDKARHQMATVRERGREKLDTAREKLGRMTAGVQARSHELYATTRQRVVTTADQHPLEVALGCLAAGVIIGLALPTPAVVNRKLGPRVDQLRDRTRAAGSELLEKGKRVVEAATHAAKVEAKTQGLSVAKLRGEGGRAQEENANAAGGSTSNESVAPGAPDITPAI